MKKMFTRIISLLCMIALLSTLIPAPAFAASSNDEFLPRYSGSSGSLVDALKAVGAQSSYDYRCRIAKAAGISGYRGSASDNISLLRLLKAGQLPNPDYVPKNNSSTSNTSSSSNNGYSSSNAYFPRYTGSSGSLVDALKAIGVDSSFDFRAEIAEANNISGYRGSAEQNTCMVGLLKSGKLVNPSSKGAKDVIDYTDTSVVENDYTCSDYSDCTADGAEIYIITKNGCPVREEPHNSGKIIARAQRGQLISVRRVFWTVKMTRWCEIAVDNGDSLYIHIDNCEPHVHSYVTLLENANGYVNYCSVCGGAEAVANGESSVCDFTCVADQAIKGSFSDYNPSFASIMGQIVAGEVLGPIADCRDLVGDILNAEPGWIIAMDLVAFLPIIGAVKYADEIAIFGKNSDEIAETVIKHADEIASIATKTSSTKLGENMREAFEKTGKDRYYDLSDYIFKGKANVAAHHIVAGGENNKYAKESRDLLAYVGIDINDAENGVFLIQKAEYADIGAIHSGRHSEEYYATVHERLFSAVRKVKIPKNADNNTVVELYRESVVGELDKIAEDLMNGDILLTTKKAS